MANKFQALNSLDFSGSNALRARAADQIRQGLGQGQQAFAQFNNNLTNQATQQGLNQIRNLDSRAAVEASPLDDVTPQYADQATLRSAYDANKAKQQGLYEDDQVQQGLAAIHGIKSLDEYGKTTANQFLSKFGQDISAAKKTRLLGEYNTQDDRIKQQMTTDQQWNQGQKTLAEKPLVDKLGVTIQSATPDNIEQVKASIQGSNLSDSTKSTLLGQAEKKAINSTVLTNTVRSEQGYNAQKSIDAFISQNAIASDKAKGALFDSANKIGLTLNNNGTLNTDGLAPEVAAKQQAAFQPMVQAFQKATKSTEEFNAYLDGMSGVAGVTPAMLTKAKTEYKANQANRAKLDPLLQAKYDEDMGIYNAGVKSKVDTLNLQKANAIKQYQDVNATTNKDLNMTKGEATQSARAALKAQGLDLDNNDVEDLMDFLTRNTKENDPYILAEVAKTLPINVGMFGSDADYATFFSNDAVIKAAKEAVVAARKRKTRAATYLGDMGKFDSKIIDLNVSKLQKSRELTAKLRLKNSKTTQTLFK